MGRKKKAVEEIKEEVVETSVEEVKEKPTTKKSRKKAIEVSIEEPKQGPKEEEIVAEEINEELKVPEMPEVVVENKKEYSVSDVIRKYIVGEPIRIFEGNLVFNTLNDLVDNKCNVIIGDLDIRKFVVNIPPLPKIVFGNLIINKDAENIKKPVFLGGKVIKK